MDENFPEIVEKMVDELDAIAPKESHCLAIADFDGHQEEEHVIVMAGRHEPSKYD
jgi:hypothetical protein